MHPLEERSGKIRSATIRKLGKDGSTLTPTEKYQKNKVMRQFSRCGRKGYEVSSGNSAAFREGWDRIFGSPEEKRASESHATATEATPSTAANDETARMLQFMKEYFIDDERDPY